MNALVVRVGMRWRDCLLSVIVVLDALIMCGSEEGSERRRGRRKMKNDTIFLHE